MLHSDSRIGDMYLGNPNDPDDLARTVNALRHALLSVIEDVSVTKAMLKAKGLWDIELYKSMRVETMLKDASTVGPSPWTYHSYYPFFLDHEDFLRHQFQATDREIEEFVRKREEGFQAT